MYAELQARSVSEYIQPGMMAIAADAAGNRDQTVVFAQQAVDIRDPLFIMPLGVGLNTENCAQIVGSLTWSVS